MCRAFSLILTKNQTVYYHPNPLQHSHTEIMFHFKIKESSQDPRFNQFVRIEISPKDNNYQSNPDNWYIKVDESYVPSWYEGDKESYENIIRKEAHSWLNRFKEHLSKITKSQEAYEYCYILNTPTKELESIIATNAQCSYRYAAHVLRDRFELGEKIIATDAYYSYEYAYYVLKDRFPLGEPAIAKDDQYSFYYATDVLNGPFPLGEKIISTSAYHSYHYARQVLKSPFGLGEPTIAKNSVYKSQYEKHFNVKL